MIIVLPTISATSAFMGATYTILNAPLSIDPSSRLVAHNSKNQDTEWMLYHVDGATVMNHVVQW